MSEFKVEVGAEIKDFQKKMSDVENNLKNVAKSADNNLGKFSNASQKASKDLQNLSQKAGLGNSAMTAFSRGIQDAPFGLMGVSNNITNLTEQFGYLKDRTGSAGGALKAMLQSLKGFGGITLLISLATSAMLMFGDKLFKTKDKAKELREEQEKLTQSLTDYKNGLESVAKARLDGEQSAQKELLTLRVLSSVLNDASESTINKRKAIQTLRDLYPSYLKNLSDEQLLNGGLKTVMDELTTSIIARARATAASNLIIKNEEKRLILEGQLNAKINELKEKQLETDKKLLANTKSQQTTAYGLTTNASVIRKQGETARKEIEKQINDLQGQIQGIELDNIDLEQNVDLTTTVKNQFELDIEKERLKALEEARKARLEANKKAVQDEMQRQSKISEIMASFRQKNEDLEADSEVKQLNKKYERDLTALELLKATENQKLELTKYYTQLIADKQLELFNKNNDILEQAEIEAEDLRLQRLGESYQKRYDLIKKFNEDMANIMTQGSQNLFVGFADTIGSGLINGNNMLSQLGGVLLSTMGTIMQQLGTQIVVTSKAMIAIKKAFASFSFGGSLVAGLGLIAIGAAFKASAQKTMSSGGASGGSNAGSASSSGGGASFSSSSFGGQGGTVVFEIQGTKLVGVLSNTLRRNRNLAGTLSIN